MALDTRITAIGTSKPAGTYFIVTDSQPLNTDSANSNLRLYFINSDKGAVNTVMQFRQGDIAGFNSVFGNVLRKNEKNGNFGIRIVEEALVAGDVLVMNLRKFDDLVDILKISGMSTNKSLEEIKETGYTTVFNTNGLWTISPKNIQNKLTETNLLNFANVGTSNIAKFVTIASDITGLTAKGNETLANTTLAIEDYPAIIENADMYLKDTFVDVYIFNNTFDPNTVSTNKYYGHLFGSTGLIAYADLPILAQIPEAGFNRKITGTVIPNVKNERDEDISIDTLVNAVYPDTNLICYIDDAMLEQETEGNAPVINTNLVGYFEEDGGLVSTGNFISHRLQPLTNKEIQIAVLDGVTDLANFDAVDLLTYTGAEDAILPDPTVKNKIFGILENGIRTGHKIVDSDDVTHEVISIQIIESESTEGVTPPQSGATANYTRVVYTLSGNIAGIYDGKVNQYTYSRINDVLRKGKVVATNLSSYKPRLAQFTDGTSARQSEILNVIVQYGIIKGLKQVAGLRYLVDCFKSFPEASYKSQFGLLCSALDEANKFVRGIINEPFLEDLEKSNNPLFKATPNGEFDIRYLATGGNVDYSTSFISKPTEGSEFLYFFGSKTINNGRDEVPTTGEVSNKFIQKTFPYDVVANATGYLDNVQGLAIYPDDAERKILEDFRWNPIIKTNRGFTIYGNNTGKRENTSLLQIQNSELLAFVKENLYVMSLDDNFRKGTYSEFLALETTASTFMDALVLSEAITPGTVKVICSAQNNNTETENLGIRLVYVEYHAVRALDKTVFQLKLN